MNEGRKEKRKKLKKRKRKRKRREEKRRDGLKNETWFMIVVRVKHTRETCNLWYHSKNEHSYHPPPTPD
jgi:hypothetical protein